MRTEDSDVVLVDREVAWEHQLFSSPLKFFFLLTMVGRTGGFLERFFPQLPSVFNLRLGGFVGPIFLRISHLYGIFFGSRVGGVPPPPPT